MIGNVMIEEELVKRATMLSALETVMSREDWAKYYGMALTVVAAWEQEDEAKKELDKSEKV